MNLMGRVGQVGGLVKLDAHAVRHAVEQTAVYGVAKGVGHGAVPRVGARHSGPALGQRGLDLLHRGVPFGAVARHGEAVCQIQHAERGQHQRGGCRARGGAGVLHKERRQQQVQTSLIEEFRYPKFGPGQLWETTAQEIEKLGGRIVKGCQVLGAKTESGKVVSLRVRDGEGERDMEGDVFFSSMPLKDLVAGMNDVPADVQEIAAGLPYRDFVTVGLLVDRLNLKNETKLKTLGNIVPDCWIYVQDTDVKLGRIQIFNNWSPYLVKDPEHTVWIGLEYFCNEGDPFWSASEEETVHQAVSELIRMGVLEDETHVLDSHREQVQKAYPAYFDTYDDIGRVIEYLNTFDNLYCVGRNGQHRYNNMDHSMATSFEAVHALGAGIRDRSAIWSVNTEQSYHESRG